MPGLAKSEFLSSKYETISKSKLPKFKTLAFLPENGFFCVSADTIRALLGLSCGAPLNPSPTGVLRLPAGPYGAGKHLNMLTDFQT